MLTHVGYFCFSTFLNNCNMQMRFLYNNLHGFVARVVFAPTNSFSLGSGQSDGALDARELIWQRPRAM